MVIWGAPGRTMITQHVTSPTSPLQTQNVFRGAVPVPDDTVLGEVDESLSDNLTTNEYLALKVSEAGLRAATAPYHAPGEEDIINTRSSLQAIGNRGERAIADC